MILQPKSIIFFLLFHENIHCGYTVELHVHSDVSSENPQNMVFYGEIRRIIFCRAIKALVLLPCNIGSEEDLDN